MERSSKDIHIIAEAGTNHNGEIALAKKLVEIASTSGAHSVKFQMINTWGLYLPGTYEYGKYDIKEVLELRERTRLTDEEYREILEHCKSLNIAFSSSVFDIESLDFLASLDPPYIKLASCDLNNFQFIREVCKRDKKLVLSTGMSTFSEIEQAVEVISKEGFSDLVLLHCVSIYPSSVEQSNLSVIKKLHENFGFVVGFSDHTPDSRAALVALGLGATWFEKHFTYDRTAKGLDHAYAMEADDLRAYVEDLKKGALALEERFEKVSEAETFTKKRARRSLYAARNLVKGEKIHPEDILVVRPENYLAASQYDEILGKTLNQDVTRYAPIRLSYLT